ncbi:MAG: hypothetical protein LBU36_01315 [Clostridiales bacterium]|jgi:hypothetical protein|nr:hypothetical protein [Clostridiales bacterium]
MKAKFEDFLSENPNCSKFYNNFDAKAIFDLLSKDENIIKMINASEEKLPALAACVELVESYVTSRNPSTIDLSDKFTRTAIGRMAKTILKPFGYEVRARSAQENLSNKVNSKYFKSASRYEKTGSSTMKIKAVVEQI